MPPGSPGRRSGDQVALLIADQRMPGVAGTEYLVEARKRDRPCRHARAADRLRRHTEAAIAAINDVALEYYLLKPEHHAGVAVAACA